jgi:hypothetical protein
MPTRSGFDSGSQRFVIDIDSFGEKHYLIAKMLHTAAFDRHLARREMDRLALQSACAHWQKSFSMPMVAACSQ